MLHACGGVPDEPAPSPQRDAGLFDGAGVPAVVPDAGGLSPTPAAETKPCAPSYCFQSGDELHCLPGVCGLTSRALPSPTARAGEADP